MSPPVTNSGDFSDQCIVVYGLQMVFWDVTEVMPCRFIECIQDVDVKGFNRVHSYPTSCPSGLVF